MARIIPIDTSAFEQRQIIPRPQRPAGQELREVAQNAQSIGAILKTLSLASDFFGPAAAGVSKLTDTDAPKQRAALEQAARARLKAQRQKGVAVGTEDRAQYDAMRKSRGIAPNYAGELGGATEQAAQARRRQSIAAREGGQRLPGLTDSQRRFVTSQSEGEQQRAALRSVLDTPRPQTQEDIDLSGFMDIEESTAPPVPTAAPPMVARPQPSTVGGQMPSYAERMRPRALTEAQLQQAGAAAVEREGKYSFDELRRMAALATDQKQLDRVMSAFDRSGGIGVHPQTIGEIFSGAHIDRARKELSEHTKRFVPQSALEAERLKTQREKTATQVERTAHTKVLQDAARARVRATKALASGREAKNVRDAAAEIRKLELNRLALEKAEQDLQKSRAQATSAKVKARIDEAMEKVRKTKEKLDNNLKRQRIKESKAREKAANELAEKRKKDAEGKPTAAQKKSADRIKTLKNQILGLDKLRAKAASESAGAKVKIDEKVSRRLDKKFIIKLKQSAATKESYVNQIDAITAPLKAELAKLEGKNKKTVLSGIFGKPKKTGKTGE